MELEVTRLLRSKSDIQETPNAPLLVSYADFLQLLEIMALKIYSKDAPEIAIKRLLLENVLLLANRRVPSMEVYDIQNAEAHKLVKETFGKQLRRVFDYYLDKADKRRNQAVTAERMRQKDLRLLSNKELHTIHNSRAHILHSLKEVCKAHKDFIGYKEYTQFCHDFALKSTSLLTAVQVGEIYLNVVTDAQDMSFDQFATCLIYMACVAYRDSHPDVTTESKVKALLIYMWKVSSSCPRSMYVDVLYFMLNPLCVV
ncbi:hypothetical protein EON64_14215 [archaeon]|nr:MAG: hypothetical protein EON64_14215 [archaeon]